jgi:hypothetical protein
MTRREAALNASETPFEPGGSVREVSRFFPLRREMHVVCQLGALIKVRVLKEFLCAFETGEDSYNAPGFIELPRNEIRDGAQRVGILADVRSPCLKLLSAGLGMRSGSGIQIGVGCYILAPPDRAASLRPIRS